MEMMLELLIWGAGKLIDEISDEIDIKPTEIIHEGDIIMTGPTKNIKQIQKDNMLTYSTEYINTIDVNDLTGKMLNTWEMEKVKLKKYVDNKNLHIKICLTMNLSENPILYFSKEFIKFVSYLNANFEIDTYVDYDTDEKVIMKKR